jgi:hypothetical protein
LIRPLTPSRSSTNISLKIWLQCYVCALLLLHNECNITEAFRAAKESKMPAYSQSGRAVVMGFLAKESNQYYATTKAELLVDDYNKQPADIAGVE